MQSQQPMTRKHVAVLVVVGALLAFLLVRRRVLTEDSIIFLAVLLPSVILHEVSHGALALVFGDDTAKRAGRLTLNPLPHIDPLGTVIVPALLVLTLGTALGWARPVPVDTARLRHPRNHTVLVSLVGPAVNIALAVAAALVLRLAGAYDSSSLAVQVIFYFGVVNVVLATFNLIPIPPLDGSAVVERLLPDRWWPGYLRFRQYSLFLLLGLVFLLPGALSALFGPAIHVWENLLG